MALVVEDGTGLSNADSYISLAAANTYWTAHGAPSSWTGAPDAAKEGALRYATRKIDGEYGSRFLGRIAVLTQALAWPRSGVIDADGRSVASNVVPVSVQEATCELARLHLEADLGASIASNVQSQSLDGLGSQSFFGPGGEQKQAPMVPQLLARVLYGGGGLFMVRA